MDVFISADIEGVAGIISTDESRKGGAGYSAFRTQMDAEVAGACRGALAGGATGVVVKDAHGDGRNLAPAALPEPVELIRGYNGDPLAMVQGLDDGFDLALFIGYHSMAGSAANPLSHTLSMRKVHEIRLDGTPASELRIHALAAGAMGVPVALVTGDRALCDEAQLLLPGVETVATSEGAGASNRSLHPATAVEAITGAAERAVSSPRSQPLVPRGPHTLEVTYRSPTLAYSRGFYPGAERTSGNMVRFEADDYAEILRSLIFLVGI